MEILLNQPHPIALHAIAAMVAIFMGAVQFFMRKGGTLHRFFGYIWVGLMLVVSFSSFFIHEIKLWNLYSPIHLLSILTIFSCGTAVYFARTGNIQRHRSMMISLYTFALVLAGVFTFLPGRIIYEVFFINLS